MFLYNIVISPIVYIVDWVFNFILVKFESVGVIGAVVGVSLAVNFLTLPLYLVAEKWQQIQRGTEKRLERGVERIKSVFKGDEQYMILSAFYRENRYHPIMALRSSFGLLIQIPFFIAAYSFLSNLQALQGERFLFVKDLGAPDALCELSGGGYVHVLPILMTLINVLAGMVYLKSASVREKLQLYGIAAVFLVLLYNSPSGLVIYWILNNLFSLAKNVVMRMKSPGKILHGIVSLLLVLASLLLLKKNDSAVKVSVFIAFTLTVALFPILKKAALARFPALSALSRPFGSPQFALLFASGLGLALLSGLVIPANVISSSPVEFSFLGSTPSPVSYIGSSLAVFLGFFVFWPCALYRLFGAKVRSVLPPLFFVLFAASLLNVFVFKYDYGTMNISFQLDRTGVLRNYSPFFSILPVAALAAVSAAVFAFFAKKKSSIVLSVAGILCASAFLLGMYKTPRVHGAFREYAASSSAEKAEQAGEVRPVFSLSRTEKNVVVIFLDRAISSYFPKIMEQFPALRKSFGGFVFYPNTLSFSTNTFPGFPAMLGGYEYSPGSMAGDARPIREKFAEASLVLPKLFSDAGFSVTLSDLEKPDSYAADIPLYGEIPKDSYVSVNGTLTDLFFQKYGITGGLSAAVADDVCRKQIVNFSVLQLLYPPLRLTFYNNMTKHAGEASFDEFYAHASTMEFLPELTDFSSRTGRFVFILSDLTHAPIELDDTFTVPGTKSGAGALGYYPGTKYDQIHFDVNVSALRSISRWLDFLRENGAWENTRIVVVSDHGRDVDAPCFSGDALSREKAYFNPLLLFKDFGSDGDVRTDGSFMTNADTLFLAKEGLGLSPKNPFSGNELVPEKAGGVAVYPCFGEEYNGNAMRERSSFTLQKEKGFFVHDDIFEPENWEKLE